MQNSMVGEILLSSRSGDWVNSTFKGKGSFTSSRNLGRPFIRPGMAGRELCPEHPHAQTGPIKDNAGRGRSPPFPRQTAPKVTQYKQEVVPSAPKGDAKKMTKKSVNPANLSGLKGQKSNPIQPMPLKCGWIQNSLLKPLKLAGFTGFLVTFFGFTYFSVGQPLLLANLLLLDLLLILANFFHKLHNV